MSCRRISTNPGMILLLLGSGGAAFARSAAHRRRKSGSSSHEAVLQNRHENPTWHGLRFFADVLKHLRAVLKYLRCSLGSTFKKQPSEPIARDVGCRSEDPFDNICYGVL